MATTSSAFSGLVGKVAFFNKLPMLHKATSDDETPTPGYMYQEITNISFESTGYCQCLLDFLVDRLDKKSYYVKVKVLKIMKHTVINGQAMFRQGLRRSSKGIKEATSFTGPTDPLHGHAPYIAVRKAAEELLEVLFDIERSQKNTSQSGNNQGSVGIGTGSLSSSKMEGFGNTIDPPKKTFGESVLGNLRDFAENIMDPYSLVTAKAKEEQNMREYKLIQDNNGIQTESGNVSTAPRFNLSSKGEYKAVDVTITSTPSNPEVKRLQSGMLNVDYKAGKAGGGWEEGRENDSVSNGDEQKSKDSTDLAEKLEAVSVTDWSQEQRLVEEITASGGVKPIPSRDALTKFTKRSTTLNCDKIVEFLNAKLMDSSSQVQLKALCVLESLLKADLVSTECMSSVVKKTVSTLCETSQGSTKTKAVKILRQLESMEKAAISPVTTPESQNSDFTLISGFPDLDTEFNRGSSSLDSVPSLSTEMELNTQMFTDSSDEKFTAENQAPLFSGMNLQKTEKSVKNSDRNNQGAMSQSEQLLLLDTFGSVSRNDNTATLNDDKRNISDQTSVACPPDNDTLKSTMSSDETENTKTADPLMCRTSNMTDLLASLGMSQSQQNSPIHDSQSATQRSWTQTQSLDSTFNQFTKTPVGPQHHTASPQHHPVLAAYPQLSAANLSGNSTVPLKFQQNQTDTFGFMSRETDNKSVSSGAFSFVQDAMKASKK